MGTPTVEEAVVLRLASFEITMAFAYAENSRPPYSFGMIMAKKRCFLINAQTSGGRSPRSCAMSHSSSMRQSSSQGPSMKACSSSDSFGAGLDISRCQFGMPENNSPSHQTLPASSASRSVSDIDGNMLRYTSSAGRVIFSRRSSVKFRSAMTPNASHRSASHKNEPSPKAL